MILHVCTPLCVHVCVQTSGCAPHSPHTPVHVPWCVPSQFKNQSSGSGDFLSAPHCLLRACVRAKSLSRVRLSVTPCCSPPGSSVHGILQAGSLEWVATPSSRASFQPRDRPRVSYVSCVGSQVLYLCTTGEARCLLKTSLLPPVRVSVAALWFPHWWERRSPGASHSGPGPTSPCPSVLPICLLHSSAPKGYTSFSITASPGVVVKVAHRPPAKKSPTGSSQWRLEPGLDVSLKLRAASESTGDQQVRAARGWEAGQPPGPDRPAPRPVRSQQVRQARSSAPPGSAGPTGPNKTEPPCLRQSSRQLVPAVAYSH